MVNFKLTRIKNVKKTHGILIIDNCHIFDNKLIKDFISNSRHYKVSLFVINNLQYKISLETRLNFAYIFISYFGSIDDQKKIYEQYAGIFPNFKLFTDFSNEITKNDRCMIMNNRKVCYNLHDKVFWFDPKII